MWSLVVVPALAVWFIGAYVPKVSALWVQLNILVPAGQPQLFALPGAYPAVGVDGKTLVSLVGLLFIVAGVARWITYLEKASPSLPALPPPPSPQNYLGG